MSIPDINMRYAITYLKIPKKSKEDLVTEIIKINSVIRGIIEYYQKATQVNSDFRVVGYILRRRTHRILERAGVPVEWKQAKECTNLPTLHKNYKSRIPAIQYKDMWIGITALCFSKFKIPKAKIQDETPYSNNGREFYRNRTLKRLALPRADFTNNAHFAELISAKKVPKMYNFEYFMNRQYAYLTDKGRCRICGRQLLPQEVETHHIEPDLPLSQVNKVKNLATTCSTCHNWIHSEEDLTHLIPNKNWKKLTKYRVKLKHTE